jgi:hypothetical protein
MPKPRLPRQPEFGRSCADKRNAESGPPGSGGAPPTPPAPLRARRADAHLFDATVKIVPELVDFAPKILFLNCVEQRLKLGVQP